MVSIDLLASLNFNREEHIKTGLCDLENYNAESDISIKNI